MPKLFERCQHCGINIMDGAGKHYGEQLVSPRSLTSPPEYVMVGPYCTSCWAYVPELNLDAKNDVRTRA